MTQLSDQLHKIEQHKKHPILILSHTEMRAVFDAAIQIAGMSLDVPIVLISLFDVERQLVQTSAHLDDIWHMQGEQTALSFSICQHVKARTEALAIADIQTHDVVRDNLKAREMGIRAYLAIPLMLADGHVYGTFCVLDNAVRHWTEREQQILSAIANAANNQVALKAQLKTQAEIERKLTSSEKLFHTLADSMTDAIIILSDDTHIAYCNKATINIFGYSFDELKQKPIDILTHGAFQPHMNQFVLNAFNKQQNQTEWQGIRLMGRHKNGSEIPIEITLDMLVIEDEMCFKLMVRDVSRQVIIEDSLRADSTRYLKILDAIPDLIYVKDQGSRLVWANKAFQVFFNRTLDDLVGLIDIEGLDEHDTKRNIHDDHMVFATGEERVIKEEPIRRYDGVEREFITTKTPIFDEEGQVALLVGISSDITKSKNIERYLTDALEQKQDLIQMKSDFVSMVSHEFRTPLSVILSSVDIIRSYYDRLTDQRRQEKLETIQEQIERLTQLMDDVLLINRGDAKGLPFSPTIHDVNALSYSIIEEIKTTFKELQVNINFVPERRYPLQHVDDNLFRHILQNLLSNAVKYSKPQSEVDVRLSCTEQQLTLVVADRGIGIPNENQANLYQTFHRANNVGTIQGTGLGLAIVKRAVDTHGGSINFRSIENEGTMFIVQLNTNQTATNQEE